MADLYVALPPVTKNAVIFGKNANLPPKNVQQVIYCAAANHATGSKVKVYLTKLNYKKMFHHHMAAIILLYSYHFHFTLHYFKILIITDVVFK